VEVKAGADVPDEDPELAPVPLKETVNKTTPLLLVRVRVPVAVPDTFGWNPIAK
jgi:hypothetical protein